MMTCATCIHWIRLGEDRHRRQALSDNPSPTGNCGMLSITSSQNMLARVVILVGEMPPAHLFLSNEKFGCAMHSDDGE
jgi:hypothetical protein